MYSFFNQSNRFNFHALRRDKDGMLHYTKVNTSDDETVDNVPPNPIDVFNVDGSEQRDFMDAFNNVVEVGAVKSIQLTSGGIPNIAAVREFIFVINPSLRVNISRGNEGCYESCPHGVSEIV